jgi:DNA phosphorothioation-associated putative methyltransferase
MDLRNLIIGYGKLVVDDLYLHLAAVERISDPSIRAAVDGFVTQIDAPEAPSPNVVKLNLRDGRMSLLSYPDFEHAAFPQLAASWTRGPRGEVRYRTYVESLNPPILHRKELLVPSNWPNREKWAAITSLAESLGLFDRTHTIGLRGNWERLVAAAGYQIVAGDLLPIGNKQESDLEGVGETWAPTSAPIQRHLTALNRTNLSAPVQLLLRAGLLVEGISMFDYGCGKGDDIRGLSAEGYDVAGWDPYYAPDRPRLTADVVNLGFVINVIEDPLERAEALRSAATLAQRVLVVSAMLHNSSNGGLMYSDGVLSTRHTFQKYYSQEELRDYLEHALTLPVVMAAPGIALVFKDSEWEQRFLIGRTRKRGVATRLLVATPRLQRVRRSAEHHAIRERRPSALQKKREELRPVLAQLWQLALELGRWPVSDEVPFLEEVNAKAGTLGRALRMVQRTSDFELLEAALRSRRDDVLLFLAMQQFSRRASYKHLDARLQRDIKCFFGTYGAANAAATALLQESGVPQHLLDACKEAASYGLGYLTDDRSLQLHVSLVDRLPVVLRAYIGCGLVLWNETSAVHIVKVHIPTGKLSLLEFDDFDGQWLPRLRRRVKINLRRLNYQIFEYGTVENPSPLLYYKGRYINEEIPLYEKQLVFDDELARLGVAEDADEYGLSEADLIEALEAKRMKVGPSGLEPSDCIPPLDQQCGRNFNYRSFVECGKTQERLRIGNIPLRPQTYNALYALASEVLDPVIDYFGSIRLTYGFSGTDLARNIKRKIAPKLDQHASCEHTKRGTAVCNRAGAACDFIVDDESMREVADWIHSNVPFDRLYYYGDDRPIHVSFGPENSGEAYEMRLDASGSLIPRRYSPQRL